MSKKFYKLHQQLVVSTDLKLNHLHGIVQEQGKLLKNQTVLFLDILQQVKARNPALLSKSSVSLT